MIPEEETPPEESFEELAYSEDVTLAWRLVKAGRLDYGHARVITDRWLARFGIIRP